MKTSRSPLLRALYPLLLAWMLFAHPVLAAPEADATGLSARTSPTPISEDTQQGMLSLSRYSDGMHRLLDSALGLVGIRYRRGGSSAESGFDCSGFVGYVFLEQLGLKLPRTSTEMSKSGEQVRREDLQPGDLVFFNTMRRAFSHVGIYLGNGQFVHAPRPGKAVRVEHIDQSYWARRYNGARRVSGD